MPIVRPELLTIHLFANCRRKRAERLVDRLWSMRLLSGPSIEVCLAEMGRSGRNGVVGVREYLSRRGPDYIPPASGLESRAMEILAGEDIPMRRQVDSGAELWTGRVDFRHVELPIILEVQSEAFHTALTDIEHDAERHARLVRDGFVVREVWDTDVFARPGRVVEVARDAIREATVLCCEARR